MATISYKINPVVVLLAIFVSLATAQKVTPNYCDRSLCKNNNGRHIGCDNTNRLSHTCKQAHLVPMSTKRKNLLLMLHNRMRNKVALGKLKNYSPAKRMPMLQWDDELAFLAELNVKTCKFAHDECRNTFKYKASGQNLAVQYTYPEYHHTLAKTLRSMMRGFFDEYKDANMSFINSYKSHPEGKKIGHFTALVSDRSDRVGCAISRYIETKVRPGMDLKTVLLACNYSFNNIMNQKIYESGKTCSGCKTGCHKVYKGLCSLKETVEPYKNWI